MPPDAAGPLAVHASAVAIDGRAVLITGGSGAGKSTLAARLLASSTRRRPIIAIGDDRILIRVGRDGGWMARPHPRIAGFIERRGLGIVAVPFIAAAPVRAIVDLGGATMRMPGPPHLPVLSLASIADAGCRCERVLSWDGAGGAARRTQDRAKANPGAVYRACGDKA